MATANQIEADATLETTSTSRRVVLIACIVLLAVSSLWVVGMVVFCIVHRVTYPFELSWMEGCFVDHARRAAVGKPLYAAPSAEFIGLIYTPIGHYAAASLIRFGLDGFLATRLVSLFGLSGAMLLGIGLAGRAARHPWIGLLVPVLMLAGYWDVDAFLDVGRPDSLLALFCLAAVGALSFPSLRVAVPLFVVSAVAALYTKQSSVVFLIVLLGGLVFVHRRLAVWCTASLVAAASIIFFFINRATQGWFFLYTVELPSHHRLDHAALVQCLGEDFLGSFGIVTVAVLICLVALILQRRRSLCGMQASDRTFILLLLGAAAAGAYSVASRWNIGGAGNVLIPYVILGAVFLPAAVSRLVDRLTASGYASVAWPSGLLLLTAAVAGGFGPLGKHLPTARDRAEWTRLRHVLSEYGPPETIWIPCHGSALGAGIGDPMRPHVVTIMDYLGGTFGSYTGYDPPDDLVALVEHQYFHAIVGSEWYLLRLLEPYYEPDPRQRPFVLRALSGWSPAQEAIWIPRRNPLPQGQ